MPRGIYARTPEHRKNIAEANRGKTRSLETRRKIGEAKRGQTPWNKDLKGLQVAWNKGKTGYLSDEMLRKLSEAKKGNTNHLGHKHSLKSRQQMSASKLGKHYSPSTEFKKGQTSPTKGKARPALKGNTNGFKKGQTPWNKGLGTISSENQLARKTKQYRDWRTAVFKRDDYTCQECRIRGGILNADHIKQFAYHPELRYDINNGRTLCVDCHRATETWGRKQPLVSRV